MITVDPEKYANLVKQDPGMAKQYIYARAGTNFLQPRTNFIWELYSGVSLSGNLETLMRERLWSRGQSSIPKQER